MGKIGVTNIIPSSQHLTAVCVYIGLGHKGLGGETGDEAGRTAVHLLARADPLDAVLGHHCLALDICVVLAVNQKVATFPILAEGNHFIRRSHSGLVQ
jgi:hypothetical protein